MRVLARVPLPNSGAPCPVRSVPSARAGAPSGTAGSLPPARFSAPGHRYYATVKDRKDSKRAALSVGGPLRSEERTVTFSPANRTAFVTTPARPGPPQPNSPDGDHRGQLPPIRCRPLPASTGQACPIGRKAYGSSPLIKFLHSHRPSPRIRAPREERHGTRLRSPANAGKADHA
jgi:hypothetical protein